MLSFRIAFSSGLTMFDQLNVGLYVNFTVIAANSQTPKFVLIGEPIR
jgi:hypothetical protein